MAAIEKTFYGNSSAQKIKAVEATGSSAVVILATPGLLWGYSHNATGTGYLYNDDGTTESNIAHLEVGATIKFDKPVPFENTLEIKLSASGSKCVVYYE